MRNLLVIAQVAVCSLLLISTIIVLRTERRVTAQPLDLDVRGVWDIRAIARHQSAIAARLAGEPGVEAVAGVWQAPLYGSPRHIQVIASGGTKPIGWSYNLVSSGYFSVFHIPLRRGRLFTQAESDAEAPVAVVGESVARQFWLRENPIWTDRYASSVAHISQSAVHAATPVHHRPCHRRGSRSHERTGRQRLRRSLRLLPTHAGAAGNWSVLVRLRDSAGGTLRARYRLQAALDRIAPKLADFVNPMDDVYALQIHPYRVTSWVAGFLAGVALLLTLSGIYGVMAFLVTQRTKEIGIRVALGAASWDVIHMILRQSARLAGIGAAIGITLALAIAPVLAHEMEAIHPYDWAPYAASAAVVLLAAVAASLAPARRAVGIDPVRTLRCD